MQHVDVLNRNKTGLLRTDDIICALDCIDFKFYTATTEITQCIGLACFSSGLLVALENGKLSTMTDLNLFIYYII